ncbi:MAG: hypothetical protein FWE83_04365 [Oscillospiraceae bacterium]|nr:hypothetical protein [Oscillospiraceae bacterium]
MKRITIFLIALFVFTTLFGGITASADSFVMPEPFIRESEDGSRVFVFNPHADENFPAMGVYKNADPLELIYEISLGYMVFDRDFHFTDDMRSFVFVPQVSQDIGVEFYRDGILMHSYRIPNLVGDGRQVLYSVSMAFWYDYESRIFDSASNTFTITTVDNLTYLFDAITGEAIEGEIIITEEVWSPFNFMEEESPIVYPIVLSSEDLEFDPAVYLANQSPINLPLDDGYVTDSFEADEPQPDMPLIIGIVVISAGAAAVAAGLIILKCKKSA